ncbi:MAG: GNAT family N-acetyltransferase [Pirellulales bacterium]|nr:GNAT family N-acetyltransferase [Pirellulales bacterium]
MPLVPAGGGDHPAIFFFLTGVFQGPTRNEFRASLEDPFYEPHDRLLIKLGNRIAGHVHVTHRVMQFGPVQIPAAGIGHLAVLPECRGAGHGSHLLAAAENHMVRSGALIGLLRTSIPHFFRRTGWAMCGRHDYSRADARAVLSGLLDRGLAKHRRRRLQIRPWRRWEQAALVRIYNQNIKATYGRLERTEAYWQWLVRRQAYDQIYVALDGPDLLELEEVNTRIVGYAVTRGEKIIEVLADPDHRRAAAELLARCCGDAIEHDRHGIVLHGPKSGSLHKVFRAAGGQNYHRESDCGEVYMARLLEPLKLLRHLEGQFRRRADEAGLARPLELGLLVEGKKYCVQVNSQNVRVVSRRLGRSYLQMNVADFTRLVLGQLDWKCASAAGLVKASTALSLQAARVLFPRLPLWRPPLDDLQA